MKMRSCTDSSDAALIYSRRRSPNQNRRKLLQNDGLARRLLQLRAVDHFGELLILLRECVLRKEQRRVGIAFRQLSLSRALRVARCSWRRYTRRLRAVCPQRLRSAPNSCASIAPSEATSAHRRGFCLCSCTESASPACRTRGNGPATESFGGRNSPRASSSTSHRSRDATFR